MATIVSAKDQARHQYELKKEKLAKELLSLSANGHVRLHKTTSNLFRDRVAATKKIDVRQFNNVIYVDPVNLVAEIEGMATYEEIVNETLKYNCLPAVVPELKSITIGGALAGCGIEASSFRYGLTPETMLEYDVLLSDGNVITCTADNEHKDLFYAFPNTYGTLGYALKIKLKLIPVKKYIKLTHLQFDNSHDYFAQIKKYCDDNRANGEYAYIDGVIFDERNHYISLAEFVDEAPYTSNYKYMQIYYQSIQKRKEDYLTTADYIWRWDSDWFWCSKQFYMQHYIPRLLFGKFMLKSTSFWKLRHFFNNNKLASKIANSMIGSIESVVQDVEIPIQQASEFIEFFHKEIGIKPIWVCPTQSFRNVVYPFYKMDPYTLYINFGFWDMVASDKEDGFYNRKVEKKVRELGGHKSLYSRVYYTEDEFWKIFNRDLYLQLKQVYDPQGKLSDLYQKCKGKA